MERLTIKEFESVECEPYVYGGIEYYGDSYGGEVIKKLADYEDAEEQGLLLKLPCKVGDTVYNIVPHLSLEGAYAEGSTYNTDVISFIQINDDSILLVFKNGLAKNINQIGITVFLSQAEVEKVLEERIANKELWKKA